MPADLAALDELFKAATPGAWEQDSEKTDEGHKTYVMFGPDGSRLFDALNSSAVLVQYDYSDDGGSEWDETARCNFALIAALHNAWPALRRELEIGRAAVEVIDLIAGLRVLWRAMGAGTEGAAEAYDQRLKAIDAARAKLRALRETKDA